MALGEHFEREIVEQPPVWARLAAADAHERLARSIGEDIVLIGSGSSLFASQLGALALRRGGIDAHALPATEAYFDNRAYQDQTVIAISQSGRSTDVLRALDALHPRTVVALTNTADSPLGARADVTIDVGAGREHAIPATKSVTATIAILLLAATLLRSDSTRTTQQLRATAEIVATWLKDGASVADVARIAHLIAQQRDVMILGTDYGAPIAREAALKFKEATYLHAEGFEAGEFRHGSAAMVDRSSVLIGIVDRDGRAVLERPLIESVKSGALRFTIGAERIDGIESLGPDVDASFNTLAWLVTVQVLALHTARARAIDSDAPRGLTKAVISE